MVNNVNAQDWLDEKYPIDGACQRGNDSENKGKKREEITELDIKKENIGNRFNGKNLVGSLKLTSFTNLRKLIISSHQIISLDASECKNLIELDCHSNELDSLKINGCFDLKKIDCSNNHVRKLDLSTCLELEEVNINNCPNLTADNIKSGLYHDVANGRLVKNNFQAKSTPQIISAGEDDIRNILIVGWTGNGKSTLANVISGTNTFAESAGGMGKTINFQKSNVFRWNEKSYRVIDNIGFGDNNVPSEADLLYKIGEGIYSAKEGINQVLFVFNGRFSEEQIRAFKLFRELIAESGITKFTTLVRTNFPSFRNKQACGEDKSSLLSQDGEIRKIIESCNGIIYVDNPSPVVEDGDSDGEEKTRINEKTRSKSKKTILDYLINCQKIYKLKEWDNIYYLVSDCIKKKEEIEKSSGLSKKKEIEKIEKETAKEIKVRLEAALPLITPAIEVAYNWKR